MDPSNLSPQFKIYSHGDPNKAEIKEFSAQMSPNEPAIGGITYFPEEETASEPELTPSGQYTMLKHSPAEVNDLAVYRNHRGKGVGASLVNAAIEYHRSITGNSRSIPALPEDLSADSAAMSRHLRGDNTQETWNPLDDDSGNRGFYPDTEEGRRMALDDWSTAIVGSYGNRSREVTPQSPLRDKLRDLQADTLSEPVSAPFRQSETLFDITPYQETEAQVAARQQEAIERLRRS